MTETNRHRARQPRRLAEAIARFRHEAVPPTLLAGVQDCWLPAVGESIAEQAMPVAERDGVVTVRCRSAVWAAELTMLSERLLGQVNGALGAGRSVSALRFTAGPG